MSGGHEGTPWPDAGQKAPFTWGTPSDGPSFTWGPPSDRQIQPEVRYATWGRRGLGFLVDFILMLAAPVAFFWAWAFSLPETSNPNPPMTAVSWVLLWCLLASCTVFVLYPAWFIGRRGQTPGMRQVEIRLFRIDGEGNLAAPGSGRAWGRAVTAAAGWFLCFVWILDYLWPLGDRRRQCLHDKIARTVAVDERAGRRGHDGPSVTSAWD